MVGNLEGPEQGSNTGPIWVPKGGQYGVAFGPIIPCIEDEGMLYTTTDLLHKGSRDETISGREHDATNVARATHYCEREK